MSVDSPVAPFWVHLSCGAAGNADYDVPDFLIGPFPTREAAEEEMEAGETTYAFWTDPQGSWDGPLPFEVYEAEINDDAWAQHLLTKFDRDYIAIKARCPA